MGFGHREELALWGLCGRKLAARKIGEVESYNFT